MNDIAQETLRMFARTKREISIHEEYEEAIWPVDVDQGQLQQVLLNLFVNAGQAMPGGGDLTLVTNNLILGAHEAKEFGLPPARYVRISISDSGIGIDEGTRQRIFEPFFTTKEMGRGTGLGLALVSKIISDHEGWVSVDSVPGRTVFRISLPVAPRDSGDGGTVSISSRRLTMEDSAELRSEERRVGKEGRSRWPPYH